MDLHLEGKSALVAGSSGGIGLVCAARLLEEGARVAISGRRPERLDQARNVLGNPPPERLLAITGDLGSPEGVRNAVDDVVDHFGSLDVVIGCIGNGRGEPGWNQKESWQRTFDDNLWPAILLCEATIPALTNRDASIVLVGSITGRERLGPVAYGTAKAALAAYATRLAAQVADIGIRVVCVEPGNVLVPGGRWEERLASERSVVEDILERDVPQRRLGRPEEIADVVCFLASPAASFITGTRVVVDGGQTHD